MQTETRRAISRTELQVESWFWSRFPFSSLGDGTSPPLKSPPKAVQTLPHPPPARPSPTHTETSLSGQECSWVSRPRAHVAQASPQPGLVDRCGCQLLAHPVPSISCPFPALIETKSYQFRSPACFLCAAQTSVLSWESVAGQALARCSWICWCKQRSLHVSFLNPKRPHRRSPRASVRILTLSKGTRKMNLSFVNELQPREKQSTRALSFLPCLHITLFSLGHSSAWTEAAPLQGGALWGRGAKLLCSLPPVQSSLLPLLFRFVFPCFIRCYLYLQKQTVRT